MTMTTTSKPQQQQASIPYRRSFSSDKNEPLIPIYTHLSPIILPSSLSGDNDLLLPSSSTAIHHKLSTSTSTPLTIKEDEDEDDDILTAICASSNGKTAILAHRSGQVCIHSLARPHKKEMRKFRPYSNANVVSSLCIHPAGEYMALATTDGNIRVLDIVSLNVTHVFDISNGGGVTVLLFSPGSQSTLLIVGCGDGSIHVFDLSTATDKKKKKRKDKKRIYKSHVARVTGIVFTDDNTMVSCSLDHVISVINLKIENESPKLIHVHAPVNDIVSIGNKLIMIASPGKPLRVWNVDKFTEDTSCMLHLPFVHQKSEDDDDDNDNEISVSYMASCMNDVTKQTDIVIALSDSTLLFAQAEHDKHTKTRLLPRVICGRLEEVYDVRVLTPSPSVQVAIASNSPTVWVMEPPVAENGVGWKCVAGLKGHSANILSVSVSDDILASASRDGSVRVWKRYGSTRWTCVGVAEGHAEAVSAVALSPRQKKGSSNELVMASGGSDRTLKLWRLDSVVRNNIAIGDHEQDEGCEMVDVWWKGSKKKNSIEKLAAKWTVLAHEKDINAVCISPDGNIVASGSQDRTIKLWDVNTGKLLNVCRGHKRGIWSVTFSDVDKIIASASGDGTIRVWNVNNGSCLRTMEGHVSTGGVVKVCFMSRGRQIVSGGGDGVMKVWSTRSGECDFSTEVGNERLWGVDVIDEGDRLVSGDGDGSVLIWNDQSFVIDEMAKKKKEDDARIEQAVSNAERVGEWGIAVKGALKLSMRDRVKRILIKVIEFVEEDVEIVMKGIVKQVFDDENEEDGQGWERIGELIMCCREWMAVGGGKNAAVGSYLLQGILSTWTVDELSEGAFSKIVEGRSVVEGLDAHCGRHVERINRMIERVGIVEHVLVMMRGGVSVNVDDDTDIGESMVIDSVMKKMKSKKGENEDQSDGDVELVTKRKRKRREDVDCDY